jgi:hypothetical protein
MLPHSGPLPDKIRVEIVVMSAQMNSYVTTPQLKKSELLPVEM